MESFEKIAAHFDPSNQEQYNALVTMTQNYPYFPTAWAYLAKAAVEQKKIDAEKTIERAATLAFDRAFFKDWIEKETRPKQSDKKQESKTPTAKKEHQKSVKKKKLQTIEKQKKPVPKSTIKPQQELKSFVEWLDHSLPEKQQNTSPSQIKVKANTENKDKWDMIDAFIENNPKISTPDPTAQAINLSQDQNVLREELMTETLARILLKQNKYRKALQAYKILSLKYPEKNSFFASQIKEIKRLQQAK